MWGKAVEARTQGGERKRQMEKTLEVLSKSEPKRQIGGDSWDYNVPVLCTFRGPLPCEEG